jgi:hypothetical protein
LGSTTLGAEPDLGTAVVFVHGGAGDQVTTWTCGDTYWPSLLLTQDAARFPGTTVFTVGYPTGYVGDYPTVPEVAEALREAVESRIVGRYPRIVFIAHSLGGIVLREMLAGASLPAPASGPTGDAAGRDRAEDANAVGSPRP